MNGAQPRDTPATRYVVIPFSAWWGIWDRLECQQACRGRLWHDRGDAETYADEMNYVWQDAHDL